MGRLVLTTSSMVLLALRVLRIMVSESEVVPAAQTGARANGAAVRVTVKPDTVYVERSETGQHLNCDFLLDNLTDEDLLLTGIELRFRRRWAPCVTVAAESRGSCAQHCRQL